MAEHFIVSDNICCLKYFNPKDIAMRNLVLAIAASTLIASAAGAVNAQPSAHAGWAQNQGASHHWSNGERMGYDDWNGAQPVDYRQHHLRAPPGGYEWRESNGQFILGAVATGLIASAVIDDGR
jgi:Ni/Co efflux regulator RcnB